MAVVLDEIETSVEVRRGGTADYSLPPERSGPEAAAGRLVRARLVANDNERVTASWESWPIQGGQGVQRTAAKPASSTREPRRTDELFNPCSFVYPAILVAILGIAAFNFLVLLFVAIWMSLGGSGG